MMNLSQPQRSTWLASIAAHEQDSQMQRNMFFYMAAIQQYVVDLGYLAALGTHTVCLIAFEEGRVSWNNLESVQCLRKSMHRRKACIVLVGQFEKASKQAQLINRKPLL